MTRSAAATLLGSALISLLIYGCSGQATADRGDFPGAERDASAAPLSPEQCDANARVVAASADNENYRIQPGDQLDVAFS